MSGCTDARSPIEMRFLPDLSRNNPREFFFYIFLNPESVQIWLKLPSHMSACTDSRSPIQMPDLFMIMDFILRFPESAEFSIWVYPFTKFADSRMFNHVWSLNYSSAVSRWGSALEWVGRANVTSHSPHSLLTINRHLWLTTMTLNIFYKATKLNPALPFGRPTHAIL